jgi:Domain of unknown function (DUF4349)
MVGSCAKRSHYRSDSAMARTSSVESMSPGDSGSAESNDSPVLDTYADKKKSVEESTTKLTGNNKPKSKSDASPLKHRMIVYKARLSIGVFDTEKSSKKAISIAQKMGGYLKYRNNSNVVLRIPSGKFFEYIKKVELFGNVSSRMVKAEDVSAAFVDITMRLNNLIRTMGRLRAILEKSGKIKDTLAVEKELTRVLGLIERLKGQKRYILNLVSFGTIKISFFLRHGLNSINKNLKIQTPFYWIKRFDIVTLFRN